MRLRFTSKGGALLELDEIRFGLAQRPTTEQGTIHALGANSRIIFRDTLTNRNPWVYNANPILAAVDEFLIVSIHSLSYPVSSPVAVFTYRIGALPMELVRA